MGVTVDVAFLGPTLSNNVYPFLPPQEAGTEGSK